ncbi:MAG: 50S ribosomal protein L10 [Nanoarchaeota archaeon]|nr:50S ribosomal protein L10 [Nanoarchaeota archaeon]MBU1622362.1 50S ribosomal protein L10 [Nanoarchaeota archaeon]MBU1973862.1 50S ribosomal protein L10 [Nanoarchaeota archaeon]
MVSEKKQQLVKKITQDIQQYPVVGVVNFESLPAQQLQKMRAMLRTKDVKISMARKRLLKLALKEAKKSNLEPLQEKIRGMPALIFSKGNPFTLYAIIQKNKSEAPAKAGQISPRDIIVKAGATNFAPGPIISELAAVGIKTKVENGKLAIINDVTVAKEGDEISQKLAETLKRLDIKPMEVGLDLVAVWEDGTVFTAKQLHVDEAEYTQNFTQAAQWAMNLAIEAGYLTTETTELLLQKAFREAKAIALEQGILTADTIGEMLAKSEQQALSVKGEAKL